MIIAGQVVALMLLVFAGGCHVHKLVVVDEIATDRIGSLLAVVLSTLSIYGVAAALFVRCQ